MTVKSPPGAAFGPLSKSPVSAESKSALNVKVYTAWLRPLVAVDPLGAGTEKAA